MFILTVNSLHLDGIQVTINGTTNIPLVNFVSQVQTIKFTFHIIKKNTMVRHR